MTNPERNILVILIPGFPHSEADTTCLPFQQCFLRNLRSLYPQLNIIILSFQYPFHKQAYRWFGIPVIPFSGQNRGGLPRILLRIPIYRVLRELHRTYHIIGLLSFWYGECALTGERFAKKHHLKHYCWLMGQDARKENKYPGRTCIDGGRLIALSDFLQTEFQRNFVIKPKHIIPSGVDPAQFGQNTEERDIDILGAGSLIPLKQYDQFIGIIAELRELTPAIKVILVGKGPEKERLHRLIRAFDLQDTLTLTGERSHDELLDMMKRTKVFLHASSYEGFSGVCLEALSAGAEVVSYCRPMNRDIPHWRVVKDRAAMKQTLLSVLQGSKKDDPSSPPFLITDTVKSIASLFDLP